MNCRVCLEDNKNILNIFDEFGLELNIASVLAKHFWFEPKQDDPLSNVVCKKCWLAVSTFHDFYTKIVLAHRFLSALPFLGRKEKTVTQPESMEIMRFHDIEVAEEMLSQPLFSNERIDDAASFHNDDYNNGNITDILEVKMEEEEDKSIQKEQLTKKTFKRSSRQTSSQNIKEKNNLKEKTKDSSKSTANKRKLSEMEDVCNQNDTDEKITEYLRLSCDICDMNFSIFAKLTQHMRSSHNCLGYITCCNMKFFSRSLLADHIDMHLIPNSLTINKNVSEIGPHLKVCNVEVVCSQSPSQYENIKTLEDHIITNGERPFRCTQCDREYSTKSNLRKHEKSHSGKVIKCQKCKKIFKSGETLRVHSSTVCAAWRSRECQVCNKNFATLRTLESHRKTHERPNECQKQ